MKKNAPQILIIAIVLGSLAFVNMKSLDFIKKRTRDTRRISDLSSVNGALIQYFKLYKSYPQVEKYQDLKKMVMLAAFPQDPLNFKYLYFSDGQNCVILAKMESSSGYARDDKGKYNKKPLYYEIGLGSNWQKLIPDKLP
jgi:hypothetical protein